MKSNPQNPTEMSSESSYESDDGQGSDDHQSMEDEDVGDDSEKENDEQISYETLQLDTSNLPVTKSELLDDDNELVLLNIPKHFVTSDLVGKKIKMNSSLQMNSRSPNIDAGLLERGYRFRDCGTPNPRALRAAFVFNDADNDDDENEKPKLQFAKAFKRVFSVSFHAKLQDTSSRAQESPSYPVVPSNLKLKLRPVGSKRGLKNGKKDKGSAISKKKRKRQRSNDVNVE